MFATGFEKIAIAGLVTKPLAMLAKPLGKLTYKALGGGLGTAFTAMQASSASRQALTELSQPSSLIKPSFYQPMRSRL